MQGTIVKTTGDNVTIHTYTSPESGLAANTHIIELASQIFVLDTQYAAPFALEAAAFAGSLNKPVTRVYVSHEHPDHFFGAAAFNAPVFALATTRDIIAARGEQMLAGNRAAVGDFVPDSIAIPTEIVEPGEETVDGVRFDFIVATEAEAGSMLMVALPDAGIIMSQDLVYNNMHLFIAEGHLAGWRTQVESLRAKGFTTVLPGHGAPGGPELYDFVLSYLDAAEPALAYAKTGQQLNEALIGAFPDAGGVGLLDVQNRYIFPEDQSI